MPTSIINTNKKDNTLLKFLISSVLSKKFVGESDFVGSRVAGKSLAVYAAVLLPTPLIYINTKENQNSHFLILNSQFSILMQATQSIL